MAVFHTHAVAGSLGGILAGVFANPTLSRIYYMVDDWAKYIGLAYGIQSGRIAAGFRQLWIQIIGIAFVVVWNVVVTTLICLFIRLIVPLRFSEKELNEGDDEIHGEVAYALWGDGEKC